MSKLRKFGATAALAATMLVAKPDVAEANSLLPPEVNQSQQQREIESLDDRLSGYRGVTAQHINAIENMKQNRWNGCEETAAMFMDRAMFSEWASWVTRTNANVVHTNFFSPETTINPDFRGFVEYHAANTGRKDLDGRAWDRYDLRAEMLTPLIANLNEEHRNTDGSFNPRGQFINNTLRSPELHRLLDEVTNGQTSAALTYHVGLQNNRSATLNNLNSRFITELVAEMRRQGVPVPSLTPIIQGGEGQYQFGEGPIGVDVSTWTQSQIDELKRLLNAQFGITQSHDNIQDQNQGGQNTGDIGDGIFGGGGDEIPYGQ